MLLMAAASLLVAPKTFARTASRIATLDWALLETLLASGADVIAAPELVQYRQVAVSPAAGSKIADLGLRGSPNLERLPGLKPDLIFNSNFYAWADPLLARIAPVESLSVYVPGTDPWEMAEKAALAIGERLSLPGAARMVETVDRQVARLGPLLKTRGIAPVLPVNLGDARHLRVFGGDSMFGQTLRRLGIENAWAGATSYSAMAPVGIETLSAMPDAFILFIGPHSQTAYDAMRASDFWNALPQARNGRFLDIVSINPYGGLPSAQRFLSLLARGLGIDEG